MKTFNLKFRSVIMLLLCVCMSAPFLSSCSDDDDEYNPLIGYWVQSSYDYSWTSEIEGAIRRGWSEPYEIDHDVWHFVNGNTVSHVYGHAYSSPRSDAFATHYVNGVKYYIVPKHSYTSTYYLQGNKVYCTNGEIFTLANNSVLYKDNSGKSYMKK